MVVHSVPTKLAAYPKFATRPELPPLVPRDGGPEARIDGPVIIQYQCEVDKNDDHHSLQKKVLQGEYIIYSKALQWFSENRLVFDSGNIFLDGEALLKPRLIRKD